MKKILYSTLLFATCFASTGICADKINFSGTWARDTRLKSDPNAECGHAYFVLLQKENRICGDHFFDTPGCGRSNEGYPGSVRGVVVGEVAVLTVTSGRNGAIVLGKANKKNDTLHWVTLEEIKQGEPEGDSPLILGEGTLKLDKARKISKELIDACNK